MVRGTVRHHPGFAVMRKGQRGPPSSFPVGDAADAIVRGVARLAPGDARDS